MTKHRLPKAGILLAAIILAFAPAFYTPARVLAQDTELPPLAPPALPAPGGEPRQPGLSLDGEPGSDVPPGLVPPSPEQAQANMRQKAYDTAISGLMPLRPEEIRRLLETFDKTKQAVEIPVYPYPEPEVVVETVSLDPGSRPPEIRVATGHVTTVTMLDMTGAPWPIANLAWAGNFEILKPSEGSYSFTITPLSEFTYGNIAVDLVGFKTPVTFILKTHRDKVHYRFDARIPDAGPFAKTPIIEGGLTIAAGDSVLASILDGVPPPGAEKMEVSGVDGRTSAYRHNMLTYVRTPHTLLSPGWSSSVSSADGMKVYTLTNAPVLLLSDQGKMVRARVESN